MSEKKSSDKSRIKNITRDVRSARGRGRSRSREELFAKPVKKTSSQLHQESVERRRRMKQKKRRGRILTVLAACIVIAALIPTLIILGNFNAANRHDQKGLSAYEAGDYETAVSEFKEALAANDQSAVFYDHLGMAYMEMKSYDEARGYFNQADACAETDEEKMMISRDRGIACLYQGTYDSAVKAFDRALELSGSNPQLTRDILYYKADAHRLLGDYNAAADAYTRIIADEDDAAVRSLRARIYMIQNNYAQAETDLYAAIKLERRSYSDYLTLYEALDAQGKTEDAAKILEDALSLAGNSGQDLFIKGMIYLKLKDYENASSALLTSYDKRYTGALAGLGQLAMRQNNQETAVDYFERFFEEADDDLLTGSLAARTYNQYAVCMMQAGDYQKASQLCTKGLELNDMEAEKDLMFNLISAYEHMGSWADAYNMAKTFMTKYPDDAAGQKEYLFLESRIEG